MDTPWRQVTLTFADPAAAEPVAVTHLGPLLAAAETDGLLSAWFFVRKSPRWRIRYLPTHDPAEARAHLHRHLDDLQRGGHLADLAEVIYEPETHAFGGPEATDAAHRLFHLDSRHLLARSPAGPDLPGRGQRRALSVIACGALLRAAELDWYEEGDVWARVAQHRDLPDQSPPGQPSSLFADLHRLMTLDHAALTRDGDSLAFAAEWLGAFSTTGRELAELAAAGRLRRGLRAVLAHHILFTWNRHGLPSDAQAVLAHTAKTVVFGPDPAARQLAETRARS